MIQTGEGGVDRRDGLRRRIYLGCLCAGIPTLVITWLAAGDTDAVIFASYPVFVVVLVGVTVGLWTRRLAVRHAERIVLLANVVVYLSSLAAGVLSSADLSQVRDEMTVSSLLTINLMVMLAYLAFETRQALGVSLAVFGAFVGIVSLRLVPDLLAGRAGDDAVDYLRATVFLGACVALLHVLAQVKEQVAEARSTAVAMTRLAHTDALTELANRRRLHTALQGHLAEAEETGDQLSVILLDLDHFKQINDTFGHDAGDEVLRHVAATLAGVMRPSDLLGRWGGEEFLVIAPHTGASEATALAERCRATIAAASVPVVGQVTASLGVAAHAPGDTAWQVLRRADDALYVAKAAGRDQVHHDDAALQQPAPPTPHREPAVSPRARTARGGSR